MFSFLMGREPWERKPNEYVEYTYLVPRGVNVEELGQTLSANFDWEIPNGTHYRIGLDPSTSVEAEITTEDERTVMTLKGRLDNKELETLFKGFGSAGLCPASTRFW
jgi:hypothetical protein